jgi:hypothetical protein
MSSFGIVIGVLVFFMFAVVNNLARIIPLNWWPPSQSRRPQIENHGAETRKYKGTIHESTDYRKTLVDEIPPFDFPMEQEKMFYDDRARESLPGSRPGDPNFPENM